MPTTSKKSSVRAEPGGGPRLKNYSAESDLETILGIIRKALAENGLRKIAFDYGEDGLPSEITFQLGSQGVFRLPARLASVKPLLVKALREANKRVPSGKELEEQVARTGWANIRDWVTAQM